VAESDGGFFDPEFAEYFRHNPQPIDNIHIQSLKGVIVLEAVAPVQVLTLAVDLMARSTLGNLENPGCMRLDKGEW
jgi:hypothetical protein